MSDVCLLNGRIADRQAGIAANPDCGRVNRAVTRAGTVGYRDVITVEGRIDIRARSLHIKARTADRPVVGIGGGGYCRVEYLVSGVSRWRNTSNNVARWGACGRGHVRADCTKRQHNCGMDGARRKKRGIT